MNSRERVQRAVTFQSVDREPIDLGGIKASNVTAEPCVRFQQSFRVQQTPRFRIAVFDRKEWHRLVVQSQPNHPQLSALGMRSE